MEKKKFYKKWWFWVIVVFMFFVLVVGIASSDESTDTNTIENETNMETVQEITENTTQEETKKELTEKEKIEASIKNRIDEKYTLTTVDKITLNEDLGTDNDDDYVALIYLTWDQNNSGDMSKKMLTMYSDDLAATVAKECKNVQEITIFWTVPYLNNASAKHSYERNGDNMMISDVMYDNNFN